MIAKTTSNSTSVNLGDLCQLGRKIKRLKKYNFFHFATTPKCQKGSRWVTSTQQFNRSESGWLANQAGWLNRTSGQQE